jgi:hypothetical protein
MIILNLAVREGSGRKKVLVIMQIEGVLPSTFGFKTNISEWIEQTDFDAVIWTNLPLESNNPLEYLKS